jgi:hypothetical protein
MEFVGRKVVPWGLKGIIIVIIILIPVLRCPPMYPYSSFREYEL